MKVEADCVESPTDGYGAIVVADGASGYWSLSERDGAEPARVAFDGVGCLNGSIPAAATAASGPAGVGDAVVGTRDRAVLLAQSDSLPAGGSSRSLETWFQRNTSDGDQWLMRHGDFGFYWDDNRSFVVSSAGVDQRFTMPAGQTLTDGVWHHVVVTYDETSFEMSMYVDGFLVGTRDLTATPLDTVLSRGLIVGDHAGAYAAAAIYPTALTPTQITNHHTTGVG